MKIESGLNKVFLVVLVITMAISASGISFGESQSPKLLGAAAKVNITPEIPVRMAGYSSRANPYSGIHDSLFATAIVFSDGKTKAAIITADVIGFPQEFCTEVFNLIEQKTGIQEEGIMLIAAHNHGGPVIRLNSDKATNNEVDYSRTIQQKIVGVVVEASQNLQPVKIGTGKGICTMNINRRARFADGNVWLGRNPDGPCDHDVAVVRIDGNDDQPLALFVNWPCHGTVGGPTNTQITGDWPGATARFVEKMLGRDIVTSVSAGASGDINPIYGPNDKYEDIEAIAMLLGEEVVKVAKDIKTLFGGFINCRKKTVVAKGKKRLESRNPSPKLEPDDDIEINLSVIKIGNIVFTGVSGELFTEIGMEIKEMSPYKNTIVITHCNGSSGYLCTDEAYPAGGYEIMVTRVMPGTESLIREGLLEMIKSL